MNFQINMSAGELFDLIYPTVVVISAVISTWVLTSARKRFPLYISLFLAAVTFFLPLIVVPLYLILLFFSYPKHTRPIRGRFIVPCIYLGVILTSFAVYRYLDEQSVDAHLSRASFAKLHSDPLTAIQEFREALKLEDNAHTHKLLAATLEECGYVTEAITEYRTAELGGERDDAINYHLAILLERINHKGESILEFKKFVESETCLQIDSRCESARQRIEDAELKTELR